LLKIVLFFGITRKR